MLEPIFATRFRKDVRRQRKRGKRRDKLEAVLAFICEHGDAPGSTLPHNLSGDWAGYRECHIEPDWLLIFTLDEEAVTFHRTGTHSDLFR